MIATLAGWGACAALLFYMQRRIRARYGWDVALAPNPTSVELLSFAFCARRAMDRRIRRRPAARAGPCPMRSAARWGL